jgi:MFS transporter, DHA1 family, tetracycline resistance protein
LDGLIPAALLAGFGVGTATPLGFAALAATAPPGRMGQTMGAAEVGRELGEAGGPLLVGAVATAAAVPAGLLALAALLGAAGVSIKGTSPRSRPPRADRAGTAAAQDDGASR